MIENNVVRNLFQKQLTEEPKTREEGLPKIAEKTNTLGWVFLSKYLYDQTAVRTYKTLFAMGDNYTYFTPNTFYRQDKRMKTSVRWINAISVDLDVKDDKNKDLTYACVLDRLNEQGLPMPSLIVRTPSGGLHIHWYLTKPVRCSRKLVKHYGRIQKLIAEAIGADTQAIGAERYFRIPTSENTVLKTDDRFDFSFFCDWYSIQVDTIIAEQESRKAGFCKLGKDILNHPAIKKIHEGFKKGDRDAACFTLALAYRAAGYESSETEQILHKWNKNNTPMMRWSKIRCKVRSAYSGKYFGPSSAIIRELSGMEFTYIKWESAKKRAERKNSHYSEWEKDVLRYLKKGAYTGSLRELAEKIKYKGKAISFSSLKRVLKALQEKELITKRVEGKGRGQVTTLEIKEIVEEKEQKQVVAEVEKNEKNNGLNSKNTLKGAGGGSRSSVLTGSVQDIYPPIYKPTTSTHSGFAPVPSNVPAAFSSLLWNYGFRDGRFHFAAWGRIQLAVKAISLPFSSAHTPELLSFSLKALRVTLRKQGSLLTGNFVGSDGFLRYLYGTMHGLLVNSHRESLLEFADYLSSLSTTRLLGLGSELEHLLTDATVLDAFKIQAQLHEISAELSARERRKVLEERFWQPSLLADFRLFLKS
ncbi:primase C-terminal domain-containing protein [Priestia aryabhattai]|uniref:primase C-terminal domain-containing protein n=1 Tax=Priestia aryabhattai TaxID=412384 RepID=UPI003D2C70C3